MDTKGRWLIVVALPVLLLPVLPQLASASIGGPLSGDFIATTTSQVSGSVAGQPYTEWTYSGYGIDNGITGDNVGFILCRGPACGGRHVWYTVSYSGGLMTCSAGPTANPTYYVGTITGSTRLTGDRGF